jgi:hypothetical protein
MCRLIRDERHDLEGSQSSIRSGFHRLGYRRVRGRCVGPAGPGVLVEHGLGAQRGNACPRIVVYPRYDLCRPAVESKISASTDYKSEALFLNILSLIPQSMTSLRPIGLALAFVPTVCFGSCDSVHQGRPPPRSRIVSVRTRRTTLPALWSS